jgi:NOL1/NOP2/fmu family ribosome biogenesis protein
VQEASSMFLEYALQQLVDLSQTLFAIDLCAAPGGKSTLLASLLNPDSLLISNEVISGRVAPLVENLSKWGYSNTWVSHNDPRDFAALQDCADLLLVDAPCSGTGLFRKMPEYIHDWQPEMVQQCAQRQQRILSDAMGVLKPGGVLIYMTCSFCEDENEAIVDYILDEFDVDNCNITYTEEWGIVESLSRKKQAAGYRFYPHKLRGEGFFIACFRKRGISQSEPMDLYHSDSTKPQSGYEALARFISLSNHRVIAQGEKLFLIRSIHASWYEQLGKQLKMVKRGIHCGRLIRDELIPEHELAMSIDCRKDCPSVELSYEQAIRFLQKEAISLNCPAKGWFLVTYQSFNLGWVKNLGNRINNYYPLAYRILNKNILPVT